MANYVFDKKGLRKVDEIEELGNKICKFVGQYERKKGWSPEFAALAEILIRIKRVLKSHDKQFKKLEGNKKDILEHKEEVIK